MTTQDQISEAMQEEFEIREAGVADLMKLYEKVESIYVQASASNAYPYGRVYTSDSTNCQPQHQQHEMYLFNK